MERESDHWQVAMHLALNVDNVSNHILGNALFSTPTLHSSTHVSGLTKEYLSHAAEIAFHKCLQAISSHFQQTNSCSNLAKSLQYLAS